MRISVDREQCVGHGRCYTVSPEVFEPDDEGFCAGHGPRSGPVPDARAGLPGPSGWHAGKGIVREIPAGLEAAARAGGEACPAGAIAVTET